MQPVYRLFRITLGCFFILLGLVGIVIPVFPQIPFLLLGALLLAPHVRLFRKLLIVLHRKYPRSRRITKWFEKYVGSGYPPPRPPAASPPGAA
jgi:uncharacterized membrane protein YbaN (DUF454 family)